jgi:outer membrane protein assembly factor BamB
VKIAWFGTAVGGLLVLTSWSGGCGVHDAARAESIRSSLSGASAGWSRTDLRPVTQPAAIGDRLLLYAANAGRLSVVALDARSGSTVWSEAAFPSFITQGVPPFLTVLRKKVIYVHRVGAFGAQLVAADPRTGRMAWRSKTGGFTSWPSVCPDEAAAICVTGYLFSHARRSNLLRFDASSGKLLSTTLLAASAFGREIGEGLFDPSQRDPELLLAVRGSTVTWKEPLAKVFTLPGASTDWGWDFDRIERVGLFVGSPAWRPVRTTRKRFVLDLSHSMSAGFRISDGSVVWRDRGSTYVCGLLPCPGTDQTAFSSTRQAKSRGTTVGIRFREVGTISVSRTGVLPVASGDARVSVEGFEPETGRILWTFDAGHDAGLITFRRLPPQIGTTTIVLRDTNGAIAIDLADGSHRSMPATASGWCREPILYKLRIAGRSTPYGGQFALFACTVNGVRLATPKRAPAFVGVIGAHTVGLVIWSDRRGIVAAPATG